MQAVAANILASIRGKQLTVYKPHPSFIVLPLGPTDGVMQSPMGVNGGKFVSAIKGKGLFVSKTWGTLHAELPLSPRPE